jgi:hypothetical protein
MTERLEEASVVLKDLADEMRAAITAYGPGAIPVTQPVNGTAVHPGGTGLWRGLLPWGENPFYFPSAPVEFLAHNFGTVRSHALSCERGIEPMNGPFWLVLLRYLEEANVDPMDCFFTNVFTGLQPHKAKGEMVASDENKDKYKQQCRDFLCKQVNRVKPRLVAILGTFAAEQYQLSGCKYPYVELDHPLYGYSKGRYGKECASIVTRNAIKLRKALADLAVQRLKG